MNNKRGVALIIIFTVIAVLTVLGALFVARSVSERSYAQRYLDSTRAFWMAEAGVNKAYRQLKVGFNNTSSASTALTTGNYSYSISVINSTYRNITSTGYSPVGSAQSQRTIEAKILKYTTTPSNFYTNIFYTSGNISVSGGSNYILGNVTYGGTLSGGTINGTVTHDASISPLAQLNFDQLRTTSQSQGNYHNSTSLGGPFPSSFWYTSGVPNVVFLEGNLDLSGHTHVGGFFVVGGEVVYNATLSGNVNVNGAIYTRGQFRINGGGSALNIDGGVWSNSTVLNGGVDTRYNSTYMTAVKNLGIDTDVQITSWREQNNPYRINP